MKPSVLFVVPVLMPVLALAVPALAGPAAAAPQSGGRAAVAHDAVVCSLGAATPVYSPAGDAPAPARMSRSLKTISSLLCPRGCGRVTLLRNATTPNAAAVNVGGGRSKIVFSPDFVARLESVYGPEATFGVLAHEFGHHVDLNAPPPPWMNPSWSNELRADAWAGCALAKAGMGTQSVKGALRAVAGSVSGEPSWELRWAALQQGYNACEDGIREAGLRMGGRGNVGADDKNDNRNGSPTGPATAAVAVATTAGCRGNGECRFGRVCFDGRCEEKTARATCGKDVDCPEDQVCAASGRCDKPAGSGAFAPVAPPPPDVPDCHARCEQERRQCRVDAAQELNACLRAITAEAVYKDCACPSWPAAKPECRQVCETAFEQGDKCASAFTPRKETCSAAAASCHDCR